MVKNVIKYRCSAMYIAQYMYIVHNRRQKGKLYEQKKKVEMGNCGDDSGACHNWRFRNVFRVRF